MLNAETMPHLDVVVGDLPYPQQGNSRRLTRPSSRICCSCARRLLAHLDELDGEHFRQLSGGTADAVVADGIPPPWMMQNTLCFNAFAISWVAVEPEWGPRDERYAHTPTYITLEGLPELGQRQLVAVDVHRHLTVLATIVNVESERADGVATYRIAGGKAAPKPAKGKPASKAKAAPKAERAAPPTA